MNWLKMIICLSFLFLFYYLTGSKFNSFCKINHSFSNNVISGYFLLTFIQWCIGVPSQFFHVSWNVYFYILMIIYGLLFLALFYKREKKKFAIWIVIKEYWFLFLLTACFSFWSMSSQLPYFQFNYDDHYYLGAIVQSIHSDALASVNYFNGTYMLQGISRIVNTFEIGYGFWATVFDIDPSFFARAVMVIHNYFIIFLCLSTSMKLLFHIRDAHAQYCCLPFAVLLIPAGYLEHVFKLRLYDEWQTNTAIWYGGSVVRMCALPFCFASLKGLIDQFQWKKLIYMIVVFSAFLSLSSIFVSFAIVAVLLSWLYTSAKFLMKGNKKKKIIGAVMILFAVAGMKLGPKVLELLIPSLTDFYNNASGNVTRVMLGFTQANIPFVFLSMISILCFTYWKDKNFPVVSIVVCGTCLFLYQGYFIKFLLTIAVGYDFVIYRLISGLQLFLFVLCGTLFIQLMEQSVKGEYLLAPIEVCSIIVLNLFNLMHLETYTKEKYTALSSGLSVYGFAPDRLMQNEYMTPYIFHDMSEYFSVQEKGKYRVISPHMIQYEDGALFISPGLATASEKIESCMSYESVRCDSIEFGVIELFSNFCTGNVDYESARPYLEQYQINYMITDSDQVKDTLTKIGKEVVVDSVSLANDHVYLIRLM